MPDAGHNWEKIEQLFEAAADLSPAERSAYLDKACTDDPGLRREVESLLDADAASGQNITRALESEAGALFGTEAMVGAWAGPYRILREIGRGGMGSVYLAVRDDDQYRKEVAVKLIRHGMDTEDVLARFRYERQILANLEHPYIARLLDGGTASDGRPFFVMEYVAGQTLDVWCAANPCRTTADIRRRCELFLRICEAVSHAHRNLVVHRDLKPANIFVTPDGSPKLLDFGVAKILDASSEAGTRAETVAQTRALTFDYASPEQVRAEQITTSTDIYSLGAILYEIFTGVRAQRFTSAASREIERVICEVDPPRLGDAAPALRSKLRGDLEAIVSMAMRKEQDKRYPSVEQLSADLQRYLKGWPVMARQGNFAYLAGSFLRRNRTPLAVASVLTVALVGGASIATVQAIEARRERQNALQSQRLAEREASDARRERANAQRQTEIAETQRREAQLQSDLAQTQKTVAQTQTALAERRFEEVHQLSGKFLTDFHDAIAPLPGSTPARRMVVETGLRYYDLLVKDAAGNRDLLEEIARGYDRLGDVQGNPYYGNLGDVPGALASYRKAQTIRARTTDNSPVFQRDRIMGNVRYAQTLLPQGKFPEAEKSLREALTFAAPASYEVRDAIASLWSTYGDLKIRAGVAGEAIEPYRHFLELAQALTRETPDPVSADRRLSVAYSKLGDACQRAQRAAEALEYLRVSLGIDKRLADANPNNTGMVRKLFVTYELLGEVLREGPGRGLAPPADVTGYLRSAVDLATKLAASDPDNRQYQRDISTSTVALGDWLRTRGETAGELDSYRKALTAAEKVLVTPDAAGNEGVYMQAWQRLGLGLADAGQYDEALLALAKAESLIAEAERRNPGVPINEQRRAEVLDARSVAFRGQKRWRDAIEALQATIAIHEAQTRRDPASEQYLDSQPGLYATLAACFTAMGDRDRSAAALGTAFERWQQIEARRPLVPEEAEEKRGHVAQSAALQASR